MSTIDLVLKTIFQPYKGILAADARTVSMDKRLSGHGIDAGKEMRVRYRRLLFSTPNLERTISGIILAEDTFAEHTMGDGVLSREYLPEIGIIPGVKVDGGLEPYNGDSVLQRTKGLDVLPEKCARYSEQGAGFLKWRSAIPAKGVTDAFITDVMADMAQYARYALDTNLVPILEPEVLLAGEHSADESADTFKRVIAALMQALIDRQCNPRHCILKTSFIIDGLEKGETSAEDAAQKTLATLKESGLDSNEAFYGIVFLSGGLESALAIDYIQRTKALAGQKETSHSFAPPLTFSYSRALQEPVLVEWKGESENDLAAQLVFTQTLQHAVKAYKGAEEPPLGSDGKNV